MFLTVKEVADQEGVTVSRVHQWIQAGRILYAQQFGRTWLITKHYTLMSLDPGRPRKGRKIYRYSTSSGTE